MHFIQMASERAFVHKRLPVANTVVIRAEILCYTMDPATIAFKISSECERPLMTRTVTIGAEVP